MSKLQPGSARPMVSVIVPCYNQSRFLPATVDTVLSQTWEDWECILVNDGSTDDTAEVARGFAERDKRILYVEQENRGLSGARNRGIDECTGRYIQMLDSDDLLQPHKLERQLSALADADAPSIAYCDYSNCDAEGNPLDAPHLYKSPMIDHTDPLADVALRWESELCVPSMCWLIDSHFFKETGIRFDETLRNHEDWDCWMRILANRPNLYYVPEKLVVYRRYSGSMSCDHEGMLEQFLQAIRRQREMHAHDARMRDVFDRKIDITVDGYRRVMAAQKAAEPSLANTVRGWIRKMVPEPARKKIRQMRERRR